MTASGATRVQPIPLLRSNSDFLRIWTAIFLASTATFLLLMTLSARVFSGTGSAFAANAVVLTQWLPAVLALPLIKFLASRHSPRTLLVLCELGSAALLPFVLPMASHIEALIGLLLLKGACDALSKVSRTVALKNYFSGGTLENAAAYYNTAALMGGGVGALIGALLLSRLDLPMVLALCAAMHVVASGLYASLPAAGSAGAAAAAPQAGRVELDANVRTSVLYFIAAVCLFQGYHNIARSAFPVTQLGMPDSGIALVQAVTNVAYIVGAFVAARLPGSRARHAMTGPMLHGLAVLSLLPLPFLSSQATGLLMYGVFAFAFEMAFCVNLRQLIVGAPAAQMGRIVANTNAWAVGSMVLLSLLGSYAVDKSSLAAVTAAVILLAALAPFFIHAVVSRTASTH
jgi:predicted MFS family arabinose efflux permease